MKKNNSKLIWVLLVVIATLVWGLAFIAQVSGSDSMGTFWFNGIRFLIGGVVLLIPALIKERKQFTREILKKTFIRGAITGLLLLGAVTFQQFGIEVIKSPGIAAFITDIYTLLVPVICLVFFKEKISRNKWLGTIVAVIGLYCLCILGVRGSTVYGDFGTMLGGEGIEFIGTVFFALHIIYVDKRGNELPTLTYSVIQFFTIGVVSCILGMCFETISVSMVKSALIPLLYCGIFSVGVGYTLQMVGQKHLEPSLIVLIFPLESVFGTVFGFIFGMDEVTAYTVAGCILIVIGLILSELDLKKIKEKFFEGNRSV